MADGDSTAAAASGTNGGTAPQPISIDIPTDFEANEAFKPFFIEADGGKKFDFQALTKSYLDTKQAVPVVPETADAYKFEFPQDYPLDDADRQMQREMAKTLGMTQAQYEAVVKHDMARMNRVAEEMAKEREQAAKALQKEWKTSYETNVGLAKKAAEAFFGKEFFSRFDLGNDPEMIKGLYTIATKMGEDTLKLGGSPAGADTRPVGNDGKPRLKFPSMGD